MEGARLGFVAFRSEEGGPMEGPPVLFLGLRKLRLQGEGQLRNRSHTPASPYSGRLKDLSLWQRLI